mmetsp:Transcript_48456/g.136983  ORF Transcript_48456/g.136983 Transcript_48456/m.136983 type:complete len:222 (+) Transcript_48456:371-1036(+)
MLLLARVPLALEVAKGHPDGLVGAPADGCRRGGQDHARPDAAKKTADAALLLRDGPDRGEHPEVRQGRAPHRSAGSYGRAEPLGLQPRLDDVEGRRQGGGGGPAHAGAAEVPGRVGEGRPGAAPPEVQRGLQRVVDCDQHPRVGDVHGQRDGQAPVEPAHALVRPHGMHAVEGAPVAAQLQPLLHDVVWSQDDVVHHRCQGAAERYARGMPVLVAGADQPL